VFTLPGRGGNSNPSSLFAVEQASGNNKEQQDDNSVDSEALELKNKTRKKFGLVPLTLDEFLDLQAQVKQMDLNQRAAADASRDASAAAAPKSKPKLGFFEKMLGQLEDTCESNWDCERPQVCCDFVFKKMCCASGAQVFDSPYMQPILVPVPVETRGGDYPPEQDGYYNRY
jgi:hypothetical protein